MRTVLMCCMMLAMGLATRYNMDNNGNLYRQVLKLFDYGFASVPPQ